MQLTTTQLYRSSGLGLLIGASLFIVHLVWRSLATAGVDSMTFTQRSSWVPINGLGVIGAALVLLGLPLLYAKLAGPTGLLGLVGVVLIALAWIFFGLFLSLYSVLIAPWLADQAPALATAPLPAAFILTYIAALVVELVGCVLFAIPFLRGRVQPRWVGFVLPGAALLTIIGALLAPSGPAASLALNLLSNLGPMLLMGVFVCLGYALWTADAPAQHDEDGTPPFTEPFGPHHA